MEKASLFNASTRLKLWHFEKLWQKQDSIWQHEIKGATFYFQYIFFLIKFVPILNVLHLKLCHFVICEIVIILKFY
jgi:hypothetical protein